jgi:hypothetical protein
MKIRAIKTAIIDYIHYDTMACIVEFITHYENKIPELKHWVSTDSSTDGTGKMKFKSSAVPVDWPNEFVDKLWKKNHQNIGHVIKAADALKMEQLALLMGAKIGFELNQAAKNPDPTVFERLCAERLDLKHNRSNTVGSGFLAA